MSAASAVILAALVAPAAGAAESAAPGRATQLQAVVDCRKLTDGAQRLACYDQATAALEAAEKSGEVVVVDRAQVREAQKAAFGFNFRMPNFFSGSGAPGENRAAAEEIESLESTVASARQLAGKWIVTLPDGAVWVQTDNEAPSRPPKVGSKVTIKQSGMGGYFLSIDGQRSYRAKRQN